MALHEDLIKLLAFFVKVLFTLLYINSSKLIENDHNFVFFDDKVSTQQHFESEKLRKPTSLPSRDYKQKCQIYLFI